LRQGHIDYHKAIRDLCNAVYEWEPESYNALLKALSEGKMGKYDQFVDNREINKMQTTSGDFQRKYAKYLKKIIREPEII
jgi:hypothetical protein